ncbi:MAG: 1-acyl-sn-glycerol-3-phosphate acyltransferase [Cryomorphaceae bacterium]|jgi:1-acyl-sn-glycerol-3-phosphate acyltransferase
MDTISQIIRYAIVISLMIPMLTAALLVGLLSAKLGWRFFRRWNRISLWIFGVVVETEYEISSTQLDGGGILVGLNQQSLLDPTAGYAAWNQRVMSIWNIEYALIPFFGWVTVLLGWIIIRQNPQQAKRQLHKAAQHAADGGLVYLSAEGKRSVDGNLNLYKKGPVVLAIESQAPIHPMYMIGSRQCLPAGEWKIRPGKIVMRCLAPIATRGLSYEDRDMLLQKLRSVGEAQHEYWSQAPTAVFKE